MLASRQRCSLAALAGASEFAALQAELQRADLPPIDTLDMRCRFFRFLQQDGRVCAYAGLDGDGADVLLRSVVVVSEFRRTGIGGALVAALSAEAAARGARRLWLLTTTAETFFSRIGFKKVDRSTAPPVIAATSEFVTVCPASAVCMSRAL